MSQGGDTFTWLPPFCRTAPHAPTRRQAVPKSKTIVTEPITHAPLNGAFIRGEVSRPPDGRVLPSKAVLVQPQVTTRLETETLSTPVAVWNPPGWVQGLEPGTEIVVIGRVRRRFFRAGGATASRVELE